MGHEGRIGTLTGVITGKGFQRSSPRDDSCRQATLAKIGRLGLLHNIGTARWLRQAAQRPYRTHHLDLRIGLFRTDRPAQHRWLLCQECTGRHRVNCSSAYLKRCPSSSRHIHLCRLHLARTARYCDRRL